MSKCAQTLRAAMAAQTAAYGKVAKLRKQADELERSTAIAKGRALDELEAALSAVGLPAEQRSLDKAFNWLLQQGGKT